MLLFLQIDRAFSIHTDFWFCLLGYLYSQGPIAAIVPGRSGSDGYQIPVVNTETSPSNGSIGPQKKGSDYESVRTLTIAGDFWRAISLPLPLLYTRTRSRFLYLAHAQTRKTKSIFFFACSRSSTVALSLLNN